ncbi:MAG: NTP transferase domain-containing protein [Chloroflexota bacterium]|nr:NTP transferase domain-containing protein [Chloroflexota bacterium]
MTVAALILCPSAERAVADVAGRAAVRRVVESAWAGGATPIVVVAPDADGDVARALAGSAAVLAEPAPAHEGALGQVMHGLRVAARQVTGTDAALVWPGRFVWVDAETVTSLIEAHGSDPDTLLRPAYVGQPGLPVLLPVQHSAALTQLEPGEAPDDVLIDIGTTAVPVRTIEVGDPGVVHDLSTPIDDLPAFSGPPEPVAGPPPEWGLAAADASDERPLEGPALAPYAQAADADAD